MQSVQSPWPVAEQSHRLQWKATRIELEASRMASTPDGKRRDIRGAVFAATLRLGNQVIRTMAVDRLFAATTLRIELRQVELTLDSVPSQFDGFRILHLTDLHLDGIEGLGRELAELLNGLSVDLCAMTGDFRFAHRGPLLDPSVLEDIARLQRAVRAKHGFLATLGNHDSHGMVDQLEAQGLRVLTNESVDLPCRGQSLQITGVDDVHRFYTDQALAALIPQRASQDIFRLVLIHSPELAIEAAQAGYNLYLCGHTHAGQICLPTKRPLIVQLRRNRGLAHGLWNASGMIGYTSAGVGTAGLPLRLFCPGEATLFTLRRIPRSAGSTALES
jgi:uncharacterized protein